MTEKVGEATTHGVQELITLLTALRGQQQCMQTLQPLWTEEEKCGQGTQS